MTRKGSTWYDEDLYPDYGQRYRIKQMIQDRGEGAARITIFDTYAAGRAMAIGGILQITEKFYRPYHEMLAYYPLVAHGSVKKVLVIGAGDGALVRMLLELPNVCVTQVEISRDVIDLARGYLKFACGDIYDKGHERFNLVIEDGANFVAETDEKFDAIITDLTDPEDMEGNPTFAAPLFESTFFGNCKRCLTPEGILMTQNGVPNRQPEEVTRTMLAAIDAGFFYRAMILVDAPDYTGGNMALGLFSKENKLISLSEWQIEQRIQKLGIKDTHYYNAGIHASAWKLPEYVKKLTR